MLSAQLSSYCAQKPSGLCQEAGSHDYYCYNEVFPVKRRTLTIEHSEIITNLKTLGLDIGASPDDIRTAFRKLARELHPDVTGQKSDFRFRQITGAYNSLKALTAQELEALADSSPAYGHIKAEKQRQEEARITSEKIDAILDRYEQAVKDYYTSRPNSQALDISAATLRLKSRNPRALCATLKHSVHLANRTEFRKALCELLNRQEIDAGCAQIIESLPFDAMTRKLLALDVIGNAKNLPAGLIISLMGNDPDVIEGFLLHINPEDYAAVLRRWPSGRAINANITRRLLESDDARILVPVLSLMKSGFPSQASQHRKRLGELESHSAVAVRAWAKKLV